MEGDIVNFAGVGTATYPNSGDFLTTGGQIYQCKSRMASMKEATTNILSTITGANVGLMRFNGFDGGTLISSIKDIDANTVVESGSTSVATSNRDEVITKVLALPAVGATPLQETLYEAYSYFAGRGVPGKIDPIVPVTVDPNSTVDTPTNLSASNSTDQTDSTGLTNSSTYKSPIINQCQDNNVILLSDGLSTADNQNNGHSSFVYYGHNNQIRAISGRSCTDTGADCLDELAYGMANKKVYDGIDKDNYVYLHTVAFGTELDGTTQLKDASNQGLRPGATQDSQHYEAATARGLSTAFQSILLSLTRVTSDSFVSPAVAVNAFNRLQFKDDLYFAVFEPNATTRWHGNIKKYKVNTDGDIIDANGLNAVDASGFFHEDAQSYWSSDKDGDEVRSGGAASELTPAPRTLYATLGAPVLANSTDVTLLSEDAGLDTDGVTNAVDTALQAIDNAGLSFGTAATKKAILKWSLGRDIDQELEGSKTDSNFFLGETLHGTPYLLDYAVNGATADVLFSSTNQGMIHAVDGDSGQELWSYIPDPSLLDNLTAYYNNTPNADHKYGLDGEMEFYVERNADREVTKAHMYLGQRRGGNKYYGIDVSDALNASAGTKPVDILWNIEGGAEPFARMGQTWARPVSAKIKFCATSTSCATKDVLVLAGGYDTKYDEFEDDLGNTKTVESLKGNVNGNAIYIVDRTNGNLLWTAGKSGQTSTGSGVGYFHHAGMEHSFATEPTVVDADFDGIADLMFAVDVAGRIWRFDFRASVSVDATTGLINIDDSDIHVGDNASKNETSGGIIADLSETGVDRRFYNKLDISISPRTDNDLARYNIVVGSGYRARPLHDEGVDNRIYFVFDRNLQFPKLSVDNNGTPTGITYNYVDGTDIIDMDNSDLSEKDNDIVLDSTSTHQHGFYINLRNGSKEKMLNPTLTDDGLVLAVSYTPDDVVTTGTGQVCEKNIGNSSLYLIDLQTGEADIKALSKEGISSRPVIVIVEDDDGNREKVLLVGSESFKGSNPRTVTLDDDINEVSDGYLNPEQTGIINKINWWEKRGN